MGMSPILGATHFSKNVIYFCIVFILKAKLVIYVHHVIHCVGRGVYTDWYVEPMDLWIHMLSER